MLGSEPKSIAVLFGKWKALYLTMFNLQEKHAPSNSPQRVSMPESFMLKAFIPLARPQRPKPTPTGSYSRPANR